MNTIEQKVELLAKICLSTNPAEQENLCERLRELMGTPVPPVTPPSHHSKVVKALLDIGIPDNLKGHRCLVTAIEMGIENPDSLDFITKELYPMVAKVHNTTSSRVERAIRHSIEVAFDRGDLEVLNQYFGNTISRMKGKPTNSEFISRLVNALK